MPIHSSNSNIGKIQKQHSTFKSIDTGVMHIQRMFHEKELKNGLAEPTRSEIDLNALSRLTNDMVDTLRELSESITLRGSLIVQHSTLLELGSDGETEEEQIILGTEILAREIRNAALRHLSA